MTTTTNTTANDARAELASATDEYEAARDYIGHHVDAHPIGERYRRAVAAVAALATQENN